MSNEGQDKTKQSVYGAMDYDVITLYVSVVRMAGRKWELQKLSRGRCDILPCFHSPYGTYKAIVELSVGTSDKTRVKTRHVERAGPGPTAHGSLFINQTGLGLTVKTGNQF